MKHKSKPKKVRRSKAAEGTRGAQTETRSALAGKESTGPRAPSPLDELLSDLHLREPVAREPWLSGVERAITKFVGELNEIEAAEARNG